jgi:hypothetical protein
MLLADAAVKTLSVVCARPTALRREATRPPVADVAAEDWRAGAAELDRLDPVDG